MTLGEKENSEDVFNKKLVILCPLVWRCILVFLHILDKQISPFILRSSLYYNIFYSGLLDFFFFFFVTERNTIKI